jgi:predicted RNA-binding protein with TRAM domain
MESSKSARWAVGDIFEAEIEKVAHGGHFIARHEGAVFFIRHGIPGEKCRVVITAIGSSFNRGDVV